jgi:hypothetical protein
MAMKKHITSLEDCTPSERVIVLTQQLGIQHYSGSFTDYERVKSYIAAMDLTVAEYDECIRAAARFIGV